MFHFIKRGNLTNNFTTRFAWPTIHKQDSCVTLMIKNKVLRNTLAMFSGQSGAHAIALLFNIFLAKYFSKELYGSLQFAIAYAVVFMVIAEYGLQTLLIREIAKHKEKTNSLFWNSIILKTIFSIFAVIIAYLSLPWFSDSTQDNIIVYFTISSLIFNSWYFSIASVFIGHQENHIEALLFFIGKIVYVVGGVLAVLLFKDIKYVALMFAVASCFQCTIAFVCMIRKHRRLKFVVDMSIIEYLIKNGWLFFSITLFTTLHLKFDYLFIKKWHGDAGVGLYSGAYNLVLVPIMLANAFVRSMYPALSEAYNRNDKNFWKRINLGFRWLAVLAFPVLLFMTITGKEILSFCYRKEFTEAALAMQILLWGQGLDFFCPFAGHILYVLNQQKKVIVITGLSVTVNIIADVILIKHYGIVGASIAMIISLSVMFIGYTLALRKWLPISQLLKQLYPPLLIALVFSPIAWFLRPYLSFWISGPIYASFCLATFFVTKTIKWSDLKLFSQE